MRVDLHMHSTASDGLFSPRELVRMAAERDVRYIALTDHDTVDGLSEARDAARLYDISVIPGIELSCEGAQEVHLLGYGIDKDSPRWKEFLGLLQQERRQRAGKIVSLLQGLGCALDLEDVLRIAGPSVSRSHIAQALVVGGMVSSIKEAFQRYLGPGAPAYLPRTPLTVAEAIERLRAEGAIPVLAHPGLLRMRGVEIEQHIHMWHDQGLMGIEAHYPRHTRAQIARFEWLARSLDMLVTGGSDTHGEAIRPIHIGDGMDYWAHRSQDLLALWEAVPHRYSPLSER